MIKKSLILIFLFTSIPVIIKAQVHLEWVRLYDGGFNDAAKGLSVDGSGNSFVTGYSYISSSNNDWVTIKYNSSGDSQWVQRYGGSGADNNIPNSMSMDGSGNVYVTGTGNSQMTTIKYSMSGNQQWIQVYTAAGKLGGFSNAVVNYGSGITYAAGATYEINTSYDCRLIKYNSLGTQQWTQSYLGAEELDDNFNAVAMDAAGNIYATGYSYEGFTSDYDYLTIKYGPNGNELWVRKYNGVNNGFDFASAIAVDNAGNSFVTGAGQGAGSGYDIVTVKYNSSGVQQWVKYFPGPAGASAIITDDSGNVIVTGSWVAFNEGGNFVTIKYSSNGIQKWAQSYNGPDNSQDFSSSIALDSLGNVYIGGYSAGNGSEFAIVAVKYSNSGVQQWVQRYTGSENSNNTLAHVKLDNENSVYISGTSSNNYVTIKYSQTVGVSSSQDQVPEKFSLEQNYPNPFNPVTHLEFRISDLGFVTLKIYNILGKEIETLVTENKSAGTYSEEWNASDYPGGIYFYELKVNDYSEARKMLLLK